MKYIIFYLLIFLTAITSAQSVVQSINSGGFVSSVSSISVGEIIVDNSPTGLIGIVAQINEQLLEVPQFEVSNTITVYPNPTSELINFESNENLSNESISIYNVAGQIVLQKNIDNNTVDLSRLVKGQYFIQFQNKKNKSFQIIKK